MTPERWQQVKELFQAALEREGSQRAAFLDEACAADPSLRREVESLIAFHEQAASFIETPALEAASRVQANDPAEPILGQYIGPYKIVREIGQGGMGAIYLAFRADDQYRKRVAIKLIKRGMDTDDILRRFRDERQILAGLDHPNIVKLLDGGTTEEGLPYFVMDYVEGLRIDMYCDTHKLLILERLELFRTVCSAVHYAHQNLVVHRDLKPSNILVTPEGAPKLLDFGIAKLLNPELSSRAMEPTAMALRLMTPEYASPEQVRGSAITTASDIYSLGVLLYQLLTGHRPYRVKAHTPQEMERVICEEEPERPSLIIGRVEEGSDGTSPILLTPESVSKTRGDPPEKLRHRLAGDLDNIVLMALRKEPQRRYSSVEQFSEDIHRHLQVLPVIARRDTLSYRGAKFIRRNKAAVVAAALLLVILLAGVMATVWQARVAKAQQAKAERRFNDIRKLANSFLFEFHDAIENLPGSTPARELIVKKALEYLDSLARESGDDPSLQRELAMAYQKVGDVQGNPSFANLGDTGGALKSYRKALEIRAALSAADPTNAEVRFDLASSYDRIGEILAKTGDMAGALESYRTVRTIDEALSAADPTSVKARRGLSVSYNKIGYVLETTGDKAGALESYRKGLAIREALSAADPMNARDRRTLAISYGNVGRALAATGDATGALESYRKGLLIFEALSEMDPMNARARRDLSVCYGHISNLLAEMGDTAGALEISRKNLAIFEALSAADPANAQCRADLAVSYSRLGALLNATGDTAGALEIYRKALAIYEALSKTDPMDATIRRDLAFSYSKVGEVYAQLASDAKAPAAERMERWRQARSWYRQSLNVWLDMRARGILGSPDAGKPDEMAREVAKCDAALANSPRPKAQLLIPGHTHLPGV